MTLNPTSGFREHPMGRLGRKAKQEGLILDKAFLAYCEYRQSIGIKQHPDYSEWARMRNSISEARYAR